MKYLHLFRHPSLWSRLLVAAALLGSWSVLAYLPYLVVAGAASGLFTGLCAQLLVGRLKGLGRR